MYGVEYLACVCAPHFVYVFTCMTYEKVVDAHPFDTAISPLSLRRRDMTRHPHTTDNIGGLIRGHAGLIDVEALRGSLRLNDRFNFKFEEWTDNGAVETTVAIRLPAVMCALLARGRVPVVLYKLSALRTGGLKFFDDLCLRNKRGGRDTSDAESEEIALPMLVQHQEEAEAAEPEPEELCDDDAEVEEKTQWLWDGALTTDLACDLASWSPRILHGMDAEAEASHFLQLGDVCISLL